VPILPEPQDIRDRAEKVKVFVVIFPKFWGIFLDKLNVENIPSIEIIFW
jgi:hypothetical protein